MNSAAYDRLPRDLKTVIDNNSGQAAAGMAGAMWDIEAAGVADTVVRGGDSIVTLLPEAVAHWRKATDPVVEKWLKEMKEQKTDGGKLLASAHTLLVKYADEPEPQPPQPPVPQQQAASQPPQQTVSPPQQQPVLQQQPQTGPLRRRKLMRPHRRRLPRHRSHRLPRRQADPWQSPYRPNRPRRAWQCLPASTRDRCETGPAHSAACRGTGADACAGSARHRARTLDSIGYARGKAGRCACACSNACTGARTLDSIGCARGKARRCACARSNARAGARAFGGIGRASGEACRRACARSDTHAAADGGRRATSSGTHAYASAAGAEAGAQDARYPAVMTVVIASPLRSSR